MAYRSQSAETLKISSSARLQSNRSLSPIKRNPTPSTKVTQYLAKAHNLYNQGLYREALESCEAAYELDAYRSDNLLMLGAIHFQLRNFSESVFYNQQCIRVDSNFSEGYSNLGNSLKELGDVDAAIQFYLKAIKLKPRFCDAYNNLASAYVQIGKTKEAIETYELAITINPGLVDAHSNLGNLLKATGDLVNAKRSYLEAIRLKPDFAIAWNNLAGVFKDEGQLDTALEYYKEAIRLVPDFADAHSNLGNVYRSQNQLALALDCYRTALSLRPDFAIAHSNLATCLFDMGDIKGAIKSFKYALQLDSSFPDAHNNLGNAYKLLGKLDDSIECYRTALRLKPDHPYAYNNLGNALNDKHLYREAIHCFVTAIRLMPSFAVAHSNLASVLKEQGKLGQAIMHYREAISVDPMFVDAYSNLGNAFKDIDHSEEAIECYQKALQINPNYVEAYANLAATMKDSGKITEAIEYYQKALSIKPDFAIAFANLVHCKAVLCDWSSREEDMKSLSNILSQQLGTYHANPPSTASLANSHAWILPSIQPFHSLIYNNLSMYELQQIAQRYAQKAKLNVLIASSEGNGLRFTFSPKTRASRLRIGYVSSDFNNHPVSHLLQSVFGFHDRSKYEIFCYALSCSDGSKWRDKIESEAEHFKDISSLNAAESAQVINSDDIHVLINLNGYTKGSKNEIFALRPSPIQMNFLGFCGTLGADYIDYIIADNTVIPQELRHFYTEKVINMPHTYFVNDHKKSSRTVVDKVDMPTRQKYSISEDAFVFCNFNQLSKIEPATFDIWMNILKRVPNAVLWLLRFPPSSEENIRKEARARGVRDDQQIIFSDVAPKEEHIKRGFLADLCLDTPNYNGQTVGCDILWCGTPMITLSGDKMASRVANSLLRSVGLSELVVHSYAEYEELAVSLALDLNRLYSMRLHLECNRDNAPLFDTSRWVKNFEAGISAAWKRRETGLPPDHITVEDHEPIVFKSPDDLLS